MSDWREIWRDSALSDALWVAITNMEDRTNDGRASRKLADAVDDAVQALMAQVEEDTIEACAKIADEQARIADEKLKAAIAKGDAEYEGFRGMAMSAYEIAAAIRSRSKEGP